MESNPRGVVVTTSSFGKNTTNIVMANMTFTGCGKTRAPKNGERAIIGKNLAKNKNIKDRGARTFPLEIALFKNNVR